MTACVGPVQVTKSLMGITRGLRSGALNEDYFSSESESESGYSDEEGEDNEEREEEEESGSENEEDQYSDVDLAYPEEKK